ncbi:MAG: hypothetical protein U0903_17535 [Planctomycetales bacterium]
MKNITQNYAYLLSRWFDGKKFRKRKAHRAWGSENETLEARQVLSAVSGAVAAEVATHHARHEAKVAAKTEKHADPAKNAITYPNVSGAYNVTLTASINGEEKGPYSGTVQLTQNKSGRRVRGEVSLEGFPQFRIAGHFNKNDLHVVNGVAHIPANPGGDIVFRIFAHLDITFSESYSSFQGHAHKNFFGRDVDVSMTGTKQA